MSDGDCVDDGRDDTGWAATPGSADIGVSVGSSAVLYGYFLRFAIVVSE